MQAARAHVPRDDAATMAAGSGVGGFVGMRLVNRMPARVLYGVILTGDLVTGDLVRGGGGLSHPNLGRAVIF